MRLFRKSLPTTATTRTLFNTQKLLTFEGHPHFSRKNYGVLPAYLINEPNHPNLPLSQYASIFEDIQTAKGNNAAESMRLFKQIADIKERGNVLAKKHHEAFKAVFYEFTQHWIALGEKLQESPHFERFETLHDELEKALSQESFNKKAFQDALTRIQHFIARMDPAQKKLLNDSLTISADCLNLLLKNLSQYSPEIVEHPVIAHEYTRGGRNPNRAI